MLKSLELVIEQAGFIATKRHVLKLAELPYHVSLVELGDVSLPASLKKATG